MRNDNEGMNPVLLPLRHESQRSCRDEGDLRAARAAAESGLDFASPACVRTGDIDGRDSKQ